MTFLERMRPESRNPILLLFELKIVIKFRYWVMNPNVSVLRKSA